MKKLDINQQNGLDISQKLVNICIDYDNTIIQNIFINYHYMSYILCYEPYFNISKFDKINKFYELI